MWPLELLLCDFQTVLVSLSNNPLDNGFPVSTSTCWIPLYCWLTDKLAAAACLVAWLFGSLAAWQLGCLVGSLLGWSVISLWLFVSRNHHFLVLPGRGRLLADEAIDTGRSVQPVAGAVPLEEQLLGITNRLCRYSSAP